MKRKSRRYTTSFCLWLAGSVLLLVITANVLLSNQPDVQSRHQLFQTMGVITELDIWKPSNEHNTTLKRETARPVEAFKRLSDEKRFARSQNTKVQFLSEWKFKDPATGNTTFPENTPSDDVILQLGSPRSKLGFLTIGLCTVPRKGASYLMETLGSLLGAMGEIEKKETVIVIFLASLDETWLAEILDHLDDRFHQEISHGLILAIQPKPHIYPDFQKISKRNFNDSLSRVRWRTKQNIDYASLFTYCKNISEFYIHIEDDVTVANNFISNIKQFILRNEKKDWFCLEFSSLGFIGKLFHTYSLQLISNFLLMFKEEQPCDLLLNYLKRIMMQSKDIRSRKALFQHRGVISSLENKKQKLIDGGFKDRGPAPRKNFKKRKIHNPVGVITTNLSQYGTFSPDKAYLYTATDYYWCKSPSRGSYYTIKFEQPVNLTHIYVQTGHPSRGTDKLEKGEIRVGVSDDSSPCGKTFTIAEFVRGIVDTDTWKSLFPPNINCVTILVMADQTEWLIINEIGLY